MPAPGTCCAFAGLSAIQKTEGVPGAEEVVDSLTGGQEQVVKTCREALEIAQQGEDDSSVALISDRMRIHGKTVWMLRAMNCTNLAGIHE